MFGFFRRKKPAEKPRPPEAAKPVGSPPPEPAKPAGPTPLPAAKSEEEVMDEVGRKVKQAFAGRDPENIVRVLRAEYEAHKESEGPAGWIAGVIGEKAVLPLFPLLEDFVNRFPASLYSARVLLADFMASQEDFDEAAFHARDYLRLAADNGKLPQLGSLRIIRDGVSRAIAILAAPYDVLGAKSYARRVLAFGCSLDLDESWKTDYRKQSAALEEALQDPEAKALDDKWEAFFASASHVAELFKRCQEKGFPRLATRVDLLEGRFRLNRGFKVDRDELLRVVREVETEDGKVGHALL